MTASVNLSFAVSSTLVAPAPAAANGFTALGFFDEFDDLSKVDVNNTLAPGFNWYCKQFGWPNTQFTAPAIATQFSLPQYFSVANSVLTIMGHVAPQPDTIAGFVSTTYVNNAQGYVGKTIDCSKGFYIEIRCAGSPSGPQNFPLENSFWSKDNRALTGAVNKYLEVDFLELPGGGEAWMATNEWQAPNTVLGTVPSNKLTGVVVDQNTFHTYGTLYLPPAGGNPGSIQRYFDGVLHPESTTPIPLSGYGSELPLEQLHLILETDSNNNINPFKVDYVRVWQAPAAGGSFLIWQQGEIKEVAGSPFYTRISAASGGTNVGPSGTPVVGQAQYLVNISSQDLSVWPRNTTIHTAFGTSGGAVQGYFYLIYGDDWGGRLQNGSYPRPKPPNPPAAQISNMTTLNTVYDTATTDTPGSISDVIFDIWFNSANTNGVYFPWPGDTRTHEFDIATYMTNNGAGFAAIGRRMFTMANTGSWDGIDLYTANFSWRFITARTLKQVGTVNILPIWRQMIWMGYADGREWVTNLLLGVEPISGTQTTVVNDWQVNWASNPNIVIAAGATASHPGSLGYHFVGASSSKVSFPNAASTYNVKRMGPITLVRSGNNVATQDYIEGCDTLIFSDRSYTLSSIPGVADIALPMPLPVVTGKVVGKVLASNSPSSWSISNDPAGNFAIDTTGTLSITAAGALALAPPVLVNPGPSLTGSWPGSASPGAGFRIVFQHGAFTNALAAPQIQIKLATTSASTAGTLDSMWIGTYSGSNGNFTGTPIQVKFNGSNSLALVAGAVTYTSDPITFSVNNATTIVIGYHVTGAGVRLVNGNFGGVNAASFWATSAADVGTAAFVSTSAQGGQVIGITEIDGSTNKWIDIEVKATNAAGSSVGCVTIGSPGFDGITLSTANSANGDISRGGTATFFYKNYAELKVNALGSGAALGIVNQSEVLPNTVMGAGVNSIGAFTDGTIRTGGLTVGSLGRAAVVGDTICMAIDFDNQLGWWGLNAVNTNSPGININSVTKYSMPGVGNFSVGGPNTYAAVYSKGASVVPNLGTSQFIFAPPTGFTGWRWQ